MSDDSPPTWLRVIFFIPSAVMGFFGTMWVIQRPFRTVFGG